VGRADAAVSLTGATDVRLYGDGEQIEYDPFCAEFDMQCNKFGRTVGKAGFVFLPETHRCSTDVCAMWLDRYPAFYPCKCCRKGERDKPTLSYEPIGGVQDVVRESVRYHTYKRDENDELREHLGLKQSRDVLKRMRDSGLASVHMDQGSTHKRVTTVRLAADFDRNPSPKNPSLFNRVSYVLTDTTRHTEAYVYKSCSVEVDLVRKRIEVSKDPTRLALVRARKGLGTRSVVDMV
jgi:hypothetical protein